MLIVLCLHIYMANYRRIDMCYLLAQSTEHEITPLIVIQIEVRPIIIIYIYIFFFVSNIVLCGLNAGTAYVG